MNVGNRHVDNGMLVGGGLVAAGGTAAGVSGTKAVGIARQLMPPATLTAADTTLARVTEAEPALQRSLDNIAVVTDKLEKGSKPWNLLGLVKLVDGPAHSEATRALQPVLSSATELGAALASDRAALSAAAGPGLRHGAVALAGGAVAMLGAGLLASRAFDN